MQRRAATFVAATLGVLLAGSVQAATPGLVVDLSSGKVLFAERATDPWYPASITKLMTVYVALDLVRQGRVSLNTLVTMSADAAAMPPSKMGFKPGTQLTLENAIKIIMVKSANDVATMIGENLGGSVEGFASLMNDAARRVGMRDSRWYNPSGLPDDRQHTTARDMALLARALLRDFPEQEDLFRIGALKLGRQIMRNHNGLLGRYPGADGMKTGFICAGGFNVVATSSQNGRKLITVVMGYPSARERDLRAANLFDQGFSTVGWGAQDIDSLPPSSALSPPDMRPYVCGPNRRHPQEDDETAVVAANGGQANADNPIASLFSPLAFAAASAGSAPAFGGRKTLGPRVAFEPIPIWLGPSPGASPDESDQVRGRRVGIAARAVRTKVVAGRGAPPAPAAAATLTSPSPAIAPIETVTTTARPGGRAALADNLQPKPAAEAKPKLGAAGGPGSGRAKLGAISAKRAAVKPNRKAGKPSYAAAKAKPAAASPARRKAD